MQNKVEDPQGMEETKEKDEHEFRKMFFETNAKYVVASYEAAREKTMNTSLQKVLKEVTEERDRVQRFMNILMESLVRVNKENSQLESKVHGLVEEEKVCKLQAEEEIRSQSCKANSEKSRVQSELDCTKEELTECMKKLTASDTNLTDLQGKLAVAHEKRVKYKGLFETERSSRKHVKDQLQKINDSLTKTKQELMESQTKLEEERNARVALEEKSSSDTQALEKGQQEEMVQLRDKVASLESTNIKMSSDLEKEKAIRSILESSHAKQVDRLEVQIEELKQSLLESKKAIVDNNNAANRELHLQGKLQQLMREVAEHKRSRVEAEKHLADQTAKSIPTKPSLEDCTNRINPTIDSVTQIETQRSLQEDLPTAKEAQLQEPETNEDAQQKKSTDLPAAEGAEWEADVDKTLDRLVDTMNTADEQAPQHKTPPDGFPEFPMLGLLSKVGNERQSIHGNRLLDQPLTVLGGRTLHEIESRRNPEMANMASMATTYRRSGTTSKGGKRKLGRTTMMPVKERVDVRQQAKRKK